MSFVANPRRGYVLGLTAYGVWGLFPMYFKSVEDFAPIEVVLHRILWSALFGAFLLCIWRHPGWWQDLLRHPRRLLALALSGGLIACNWLTYVWAVQNGHMVEASLGYYINPLVNVILGMLFLRERLRPLQWLALSLAAAGVIIRLVQLGSLPWVALTLAFSFGFYGLIRKQAPVAALPGLVVETWLLVLPALLWLFLSGDSTSYQLEFLGSSAMFLLALAGPVTLLPLLSFNEAAKHLPYSSIAFLQYITPTVLLLLAVFLYGEPFAADAWLFFGFIWAALLVYSLDTWRMLRRSKLVLE